jgi:hypothetical protein
MCGGRVNDEHRGGATLGFLGWLRDRWSLCPVSDSESQAGIFVNLTRHAELGDKCQ